MRPIRLTPPPGAALALVLAAAGAVPVAAQAPALPVPVMPTVPAVAPAAAGADFDLSVANIMRGELLVGRSPSEVRWSEDSRHVYFRWRDPESADTTTHLYRVPAGGGEPERLADSVALRRAPAIGGSWSADRRRRAVLRSGDVYVVDVSGREWRITDTPDAERAPHLSPDGSTVYFLGDGNLFAVALDGGPLRQLTDLRLAAEPEDEDAEGQRRYLEEQQRELFGVVRDRVEEREHRERVDSLRRQLPPVYLGGEKVRLLSAEVAPSGRFALLAVSDPAEEKETIVPNFVTESGYTEDLVVRSKVGDAQAGQRAAILDLASGELSWIRPGPGDRGLTLIPVGWAPRADRALVISVAADYKDRWIHVVAPGSEPVVLDHLRDDAWVGGPGLFTVGWLPDGERAYFVSERTGWAHLYTVPAAGGEARALTAGAWEVRDVQLSGDGRTFFVTTSEVHPGEQHLYALPADGGERARLTAMEGWNESIVSPDGRHVAVLHSQANLPPDLYLLRRGQERGRRVTVSTTEAFRRGPWIQPEVLTIPARDGAPVYARIYRPRDLGAEPTGAAVLFVHGAGYLQNAHRGWSTYFREYMFHHLLASRGYTVLDVDYRGSAGYGREWRTGIYRHMGGKDLTDHVDAARWLAANEGVDPSRVGIYGGSYGGFITLMGMFTEPEVFRAGAALRSVTDWAHYNHWYTSRILNQPHEDPEAYRRSSPIYFAEGLEGDLLIAHGMVDTNVHFQDVVRLAQRLIELGKTGWEMAVYPVEDHGFVRPESWTDEYRRILELFEETIGNRR